MYSIILNKNGKEIKTIDDISFREHYVILIQSNYFNIQVNQNTPLKEIKPDVDLNSDIKSLGPISSPNSENADLSIRMVS